MRIWTSGRWKHIIPQRFLKYNNRVEINCAYGVDRDLRSSIYLFISWMKNHYQFPMPITVYIVNKRYIYAADGDRVVGTCYQPASFEDEAYIRIAVGDYSDLLKRGRDNAIASILYTLAHEITHYYQWINGSHLPTILSELQAEQSAKRILRLYAMTREHP